MEAIAANILLEGLAVNALAQCETPVTLVTTDSREVCPGCIFVAFPGEKFDGHDFAAGTEAILLYEGECQAHDEG